MIESLRRIGWFLWRELTAISRIGAFWLAMAAYVVVLGAFVLTWSGGIPTLRGAFSDQMYRVQLLLLAVLLPWTAVRCSGSGDLPGLTMLAALTGARSSAVIAAKALGIIAALIAIVLSGMPFAVLAEQISARPVLQMLSQLATFLALAVFVGAASTAAVHMRLQRLWAWLLTTVVSVAVASAITWS